MSLTPEQIYQLNANEARKRELRVQIARTKGQLDASAALSQMISRLNQDTQVQRQEQERELSTLESGGAVGTTDDWGKFSALDHAMHAERFAAKDFTFDWLQANPDATLEEAVAQFDGAMLAARTARGRPWLLQSGAGLIQEWMSNAVSAGLIPAPEWEAFRAYLLTITKEEAVGVGG
jgi:hypothetical protein